MAAATQATTTDTLAQAQDALLGPTALESSQIARVLGSLMRPNVDAADLYFQRRRREGWALEDGIVRTASAGVEQGVGARAISGEKTGFAYSEDLTLPALTRAGDAASAIVQAGSTGRVAAWQSTSAPSLYAALDPADGWDEGAKVALLHRADAAARNADDRVTQVQVSLAGVQDVVMVAASDGTLAGDVRPLVRLTVTVQVAAAGRRERASAGGGGRCGYDFFVADDEDGRARVEGYALEAVRRALVRLSAEDAPAGTMSVVLGPGWPGVLLHEAVGHGLEGDFNRKGSSTYSGRVGEKVASELCTIVDDGTIAGRRGSLSMDDEGVPGGFNTLIRDGVLVGYMQDKHNAGLMGVAPTGNGRRESFAHLPMPRMTNTYMLPGNDDPAAILGSVDEGIFAANFDGGSVDITSGNFVFSASEAYRIEGGRLGAPIKGVTLIGNGPDVLEKVSMVGNDLALDTGIGVCGKNGQSVPVGVGQPTLRVDGLTVGGTQG
ncbi:metalloprotease TldD [Spectribacter hydrogenoxidans]|uniref:Metalloprotease TldD n=1 Tax=Spectribacter hydrogenoxidans TaxID=3075608 RepID=A0ABU3BZ44_9GAMM|nr:metalloprotease TldD [Salinisphaera sp. W335]MDT0634535.1 metalloprotease TldD [Salinisphaera sp. W335]